MLPGTSERRVLQSLLLFSISWGFASRGAAAGFDEHRIRSLQGDQPGAGFGSAVASGDVNGDGFRDVIVGAPSYNGLSGPLSGKVFAYYGSATGLASSPSWSVEGEPPADPLDSRLFPYFGSTLASADVNGDGYDDVVVGSYGYDTPEDHPFQGAGRVYVYYGSAEGPSVTPSFVATGWSYDQGFVTGLGYTLDTGDFNGDGYADVVASSHQRYSGGAVVYYGSASGLSPDNSWILKGALDHRGLGASVSAGDFNGDGYDDLIVTAKESIVEPEPPWWGALLYLGSAEGLPSGPEGQSTAVPPSSTFTDWLTGTSVGDLDGDGYDDVLVQEFHDDLLGLVPRLVLYRGSPLGPRHSQELGTIVDFPDLYAPVHAIGDLNGDGTPDLVVLREGSLFCLFFGSASGFPPLSDGMGPSPGQAFATAGDVDGDGIDDLVVGDSTNGRAELYRGGADWSFSATADLSLQQVTFEGGFDLTVTNKGPETVRAKLFVPVPATWSGAQWFCPIVDASPPTAASADCFRGGTGDLDSVITIEPGGELIFEFSGGVLSVPVVSVASLVLPEWVTDPDLSNNQAINVVGPPLRLLFLDSFESGDLSAWSTHTGRGLEVVPSAALQGDYGLQVTAPHSGSAVVRDYSPADIGDYHSHFLFDPNGFGLKKKVRGASARDDRPDLRERAVLFSGHGQGSGAPLFEIVVERKPRSLALQARAFLDDGSVLESALVPITDARHLIEVAWRRSREPAASDGQLQLRLDGADAAALVGLDNDTEGLDYVELGLVSKALPGSIERTVFVDAFESWRFQ